MIGGAIGNLKTHFRGKGYIAGEVPGIVTVAGSAASRRVVVLDKQTRLPVRSTVSAADGTFRIDGLNPNRNFVVIAFDHQLQFNAVIRDNITPAPMP